jgi:hypothetical protein
VRAGVQIPFLTILLHTYGELIDFIRLALVMLPDIILIKYFLTYLHYIPVKFCYRSLKVMLAALNEKYAVVELAVDRRKIRLIEGNAKCLV